MKKIIIDRGIFREYRLYPSFIEQPKWILEMRKLVRWIQRNRMKRMYFSANQNAVIVK